MNWIDPDDARPPPPNPRRPWDRWAGFEVDRIRRIVLMESVAALALAREVMKW